jgi:ketosteroid isomerase-like protein
MRLTRSLSIGALTTLGACASGGGAAAHVESLRAADAELARQSLARGAADAFDARLADDAIELPPGRGAVAGRTAIVDGLRALDDGWVLDRTPAHAEASADGSLGWTRGRYALYRRDTPHARETGEYLTVWRRGRDGRWRVAAEIGNPSPAAPD